ncbi:hypothetical protein J2127_001138 [Methanococcus voltae]|uniref:hypothetical protein n=1 Tax=Methanococcus voltae TaxID=2188 RepID=UPI001AE7A400|nr:hypothetical protein [Methanococcus voltae]MBP2143969.1 hypothetical protein [Methanococcus voltae]
MAILEVSSGFLLGIIFKNIVKKSFEALLIQVMRYYGISILLTPLLKFFIDLLIDILLR